MKSGWMNTTTAKRRGLFEASNSAASNQADVEVEVEKNPVSTSAPDPDREVEPMNVDAAIRTSEVVLPISASAMLLRTTSVDQLAPLR